MDLGTAYKELKPLLFEALSRLARQRFVVRPDDAVDLVHDFLAHELGGLQSRYDPEKGGFKGYAYKAFIQFARPRIMQLQRLHESLVDPEALDAISAPEINNDLELSPEYQNLVRQAIGTLTANEASVLLTYVNANVPSERLLAKGLKISRSDTRQILVRALGQVITELPRPPGIAIKDWNVAHALWRDQRTISETASYLNLTSPQVRLAQARVTRFLETSLQNMQRLRRYTRRLKMKGERYTIPAHELFGRVMKEVGNVDLLEELRDRAEEVISALGYYDSDQPPDESQWRDAELDPDWLADVYEALAAGAELSREEQAVVEAFFQAGVDEERSVGEAFRQVLWADLPAHLHDLSRWFDDSQRIDANQMKELLTDPSVKGGLPEATLFLVYGVTPMTIYHATEAVTSALERLQGYGWIGEGSSISLYPDRAEASQDEQGILSVDLLVAEIYTSARCDKTTARSLYSWLAALAQYKPLIFDTYEAIIAGEGVQLRQRDESTSDLFQRWRSVRTRKPVAKDKAIGHAAGQFTSPIRARALSPQKAPDRQNWIAVLMNPEDVPGEEYLQQGVSSGIARSLSLLPGLSVKESPQLSFSYEQINDVKLLQGMGKELGVKSILAGWVKPEEDQFHCHAQLIDTEAGKVWHRAYDATLGYDAISEVEKDISQRVASHLHIPITKDWADQLECSGTDNPEAQKLYMEGRFNWNKWSPDGVEKALSCYERATERAPHFSLAYAAKADCYNSDYISKETPLSALAKANEEAHEALKYIDLPEAYASLAYAHTRYWKWKEAETQFERALELNPSYALARKWYAIHLTALGRLREALAQLKLAEKYNPSSPIIMTALGVTYYFARQYEVAREQFQAAIGCNPELLFPHLGLGIVYAQTGRYEEAIEVLRRAARDLFPGNTKALAALGLVLADMGNETEARQILDELNAKSRVQYESPYGLALIHTALKEHDLALEDLGKALEYKDPPLILLKVDPRFDAISNDTRFQAIAAQIGV